MRGARTELGCLLLRFVCSNEWFQMLEHILVSAHVTNKTVFAVNITQLNRGRKKVHSPRPSLNQGVYTFKQIPDIISVYTFFWMWNCIIFSFSTILSMKVFLGTVYLLFVLSIPKHRAVMGGNRVFWGTNQGPCKDPMQQRVLLLIGFMPGYMYTWTFTCNCLFVKQTCQWLTSCHNVIGSGMFI
jgi:hypothetical protein